MNTGGNPPLYAQQQQQQGQPPPPSSPMHPVAPPTKRQRSGNQPPLRDRGGGPPSVAVGGKDALSAVADDAISRRRAELRRLQEKRAEQQNAKGGLLDQARSQLGGSTALSSTSTAGPPGMPQRQHHVARARHSDIFPTVPKTASTSTLKPTPRVARRLDPAFRERTSSNNNNNSRSKSAPPSRPPPPPIPPPLVAEAPPERSSPPKTNNDQPTTPAAQTMTTATTTTPGSTASSARRDALRNLRDMAPAPTQDMELVKELKLAQEEKADALRKVARLKEQIQYLQKPQQQHPTIMSPQQEQQQQPVSQVAFLSPLSASATPAHGPHSAASSAFLGSAVTRNKPKRMPTPHPKRKQHSPSGGTRDDDHEQECLKEAALSIPFEYTSALATYVVRRPFVSQDDDDDETIEDDLWKKTAVEGASQSAGAYQANTTAHCHNMRASMLEVASKISADGSLLTLSGVSTVRHQNHASKEWRVFDNVDDMDKPLGCITYIDSDASEKEYWLDAIYEEAFAAREAYCSSLISTAAALQTRKPQRQPSLGAPSAIERPTSNASSKSAGANATDGAPTAEPEKRVAQAHDQLPASSTKPAATAKSASKDVVDESALSDVLSVVLGMLFSSLFGLIWLVLVRIPFKIFTFSLLLVTASAFLSVVWLYLADDHGAQSMGAALPYGFNRPGIV